MKKTNAGPYRLRCDSTSVCCESLNNLCGFILGSTDDTVSGGCARWNINATWRSIPFVQVTPSLCSLTLLLQSHRLAKVGLPAWMKTRHLPRMKDLETHPVGKMWSVDYQAMVLHMQMRCIMQIMSYKMMDMWTIWHMVVAVLKCRVTRICYTFFEQSLRINSKFQIIIELISWLERPFPTLKELFPLYKRIQGWSWKRATHLKAFISLQKVTVPKTHEGFDD